MLWDDFLNSDYHDWRKGGISEDRLDTPGWLDRWLARHGLPNPGEPTAAQMSELKQLRSRMLQTVRSLVAGNAVSAGDIEALNKPLANGPIVRRLTATGSGIQMDTQLLRADWTSIQAEIVASFGQTLAEGDYARLRICDNPDCLWVYYDETRNRSKRYCDDKMCGNLMKVRRFRARRKSDPTQAPDS